jgi:hypothetical protein
LVETKVSEKSAVSILSPEDGVSTVFQNVGFYFSPEDGDSTRLQNIGFYQPIKTAT